MAITRHNDIYRCNPLNSISTGILTDWHECEFLPRIERINKTPQQTAPIQFSDNLKYIFGLPVYAIVNIELISDKFTKF